MKLVSFKIDNTEYAGLYYDKKVYKLNDLDPALPGKMEDFISAWETHYPLAVKINSSLATNKTEYLFGKDVEEVTLLAPLPNPPSCRDGYAFRQHVATARRNRNLPMIPEFDQFPIFYFTNHRSIQGPGRINCMPDHFHQLDFELEVAIIVCKQGRNISAKDADQYIGGLMIMNDMSARTLQMEEMRLNLGPAKGKDFATVIGPYLVTLDELSLYETPAANGHVGKTWNLKMTNKVNGKIVSEGNLKDMDWTFAEIIERVSYGVDIYPGDVIGSGTVGTGCFLELNGTGKLNDPQFKEQWLQDGDVVEMEIEGLGVLVNTIVAEKTDHSILKLKKL